MADGAVGSASREGRRGAQERPRKRGPPRRRFTSPGTVHVNLPRIARVARALGIDYASALVGFEFHRGGKTTPKFEGVVVCEEFEGRLREAHAEEEARLVAAKAERERREAKARWRVLFSAMWTRLSLREEFAMDDGDDNGDGGGEPDEREKTRLEEETVDRERRGGGKRARLVADEEDVRKTTGERSGFGSAPRRRRGGGVVKRLKRRFVF